MRWLYSLVAMLGLAILLLAPGCSSGGSNENKAAATTSSNATETAKDVAPDADIASGLAKLTAEDRALALSQKICPVSGERLGEMGEPVKLDVKGQPVFICCEGCKDKILSHPDEYLAKLKK